MFENFSIGSPSTWFAKPDAYAALNQPENNTMSTGISGMPAPATPMPETQTIMGMTPNSFASIAGQMGSAISKSQKGAESPMGRIGSIAASLGQAQLAAIAAEKQHKANGEFMKNLLAKGFMPGLVPQVNSMDSTSGDVSKHPSMQSFADMLKKDASAGAGGTI